MPDLPTGKMLKQIVKRVMFRYTDKQKLAELRDILQKKDPMKTLTDSDVIRMAVGIAHGLLSTGEVHRGPTQEGSST